MTDTTVAPAPVKKGRTWGYFTVRQGFAIPFSLALALFFLFWNPHAETAAEGALWMFIPSMIIFGWYLGITQIRPVITAPMFESHFAAAKDFGVSIWPPIVTSVMLLLSATMGTVEVLWIHLDIDMTKIELGIAAMVYVAFGLDAMGSIFTLLKNRLTSEEGMGRMAS